MIQYKPLSMADYEYPSWAQGIGWVIAVLSIVCIPAGMVHALIKAKGKNLWQVKVLGLSELVFYGMKEMFYLTMHSMHFIYGYVASDMWLNMAKITGKTRDQSAVTT